MIHINKNNIREAIKNFATDIENRLSDEDSVFVEILSQKQEKTRKQNNLFHSLLDCFWESGCSSFASRRDMRWHYKYIAGLIEIEYISPLDEYTKKCIWKAIKILPLDTGQQKSVIDLLKGKVLKEHSWGEASKTNAKRAIEELIRDMDSAGVVSVSRKYAEILKGIGEIV